MRNQFQLHLRFLRELKRELKQEPRVELTKDWYKKWHARKPKGPKRYKR